MKIHTPPKSSYGLPAEGLAQTWENPHMGMSCHKNKEETTGGKVKITLITLLYTRYMHK